jgi:hypothetical protein
MQNAPTKILAKCIEKILFYLGATKHIGIVYQRKPTAPLLSVLLMLLSEAKMKIFYLELVIFIYSKEIWSHGYQKTLLAL